MSHGVQETQRLQTNVETQLNRLLKQLEDCEELKGELDQEEYEVTKQETLDQMNEFRATLKKMTEGNITLVNQFGSVQLAMQAAVSKAFQTPEIIKLFAKNQPKQLRAKMNEIERDYKLGKVQKDVYTLQVQEILGALQKLGDELSEQEKEFLNANMTAEMKNFVTVDNTGAQIDTASVSSQIEKARK